MEKTCWIVFSIWLCFTDIHTTVTTTIMLTETTQIGMSNPESPTLRTGVSFTRIDVNISQSTTFNLRKRSFVNKWKLQHQSKYNFKHRRFVKRGKQGKQYQSKHNFKDWGFVNRSKLQYQSNYNNYSVFQWKRS